MTRSIEGRSHGDVESVLREDFRLELIRFRYLGYLSYGDLVWASIGSGGGLLGLVGVVSLTEWAMTVIVVLGVIALGLLVVGLVVMRCQRVTVIREAGLYVARDEETALVRHGRTPSEAVRYLGAAVAHHGAATEEGANAGRVDVGSPGRIARTSD